MGMHTSLQTWKAVLKNLQMSYHFSPYLYQPEYYMHTDLNYYAHTTAGERQSYQPMDISSISTSSDLSQVMAPLDLSRKSSAASLESYSTLDDKNDSWTDEQLEVIDEGSNDMPLDLTITPEVNNTENGRHDSLVQRTTEIDNLLTETHLSG